MIQLKNNIPKSLHATLLRYHVRVFTIALLLKPLDTGCTIMDDFMKKANDMFPTQTQIENLTLQPNGFNAQRVRATNKRCACATREDKNPDRTRNSQQHVIYA